MNSQIKEFGLYFLGVIFLICSGVLGFLIAMLVKESFHNPYNFNLRTVTFLGFKIQGVYIVVFLFLLFLIFILITFLLDKKLQSFYLKKVISSTAESKNERLGDGDKDKKVIGGSESKPQKSKFDNPVK